MFSVPDKRLSGLSQSLTVPIAHHSKGEREEKILKGTGPKSLRRESQHRCLPSLFNDEQNVV